MSLETKVNDINRSVNTEKFINIKTEKYNIANYYKRNKLPYDLFHNRLGFIHMGLSKDGKYSEKDLYEQPKLISEYFTNRTTHVLELGCGKGQNSIFLARKFPSIQFVGIDLPDGQTDVGIKKAKAINNLNIFYDDFHELNTVQDTKFDIIFAIEALCHSSSKDVVANKVHNLLKDNGLFIVIDGYLGKEIGELDESELLAKKLTEKGMVVENFEYYPEVKDKIIGSGLELVEEKDYSEEILPTLSRFEKLAKILFKVPSIGRISFNLLPSEIIANSLSGYLMTDLIKLRIAKYMLSVFRKVEVNG